jgi:hypothetical protein
VLGIFLAAAAAVFLGPLVIKKVRGFACEVRAPATPSLISDPHRETTIGCCLHEEGETGNHPTINEGEAKAGIFSW